MGSPLFVVSDGRVLRPASKAAAVALEALPRGVPLKVEPTQPRRIKLHRLGWGLATLVAKALNDGPTPVDWDAERVMTHFKLATGHVETVKLRPADAKRLGVTHAALPRSVSFSRMGEDEFSRFVRASMEHVRDVLCPWIEGSEHWPEIETILRDSHMMSAEARAAA